MIVIDGKPIPVDPTKIEALKLAYDLADKLKIFLSASSYEDSKKTFEEDLDYVFKIADMNYEYLMGVKIPKK